MCAIGYSVVLICTCQRFSITYLSTKSVACGIVLWATIFELPHPSPFIRTALAYNELRGTPSCLAASLAACEGDTPDAINPLSCASICASDGVAASVPNDPSTTIVTSPCAEAGNQSPY